MHRRRIIIIGLVWASIALQAARAQAPCEIGWRAPVRISPDTSVPTLPAIAVSGDTVHLTWFGLDTTSGGTLARSGLCYSRSTDGGATFSEPVRLLSPFESVPGQLAVRGHRVSITAGAFLEGFFGVVLFTSTDAGATWSDPVPVLAGSFPELLFDWGGGLVLGYREVESAWFGLLGSTDGGRTWRQLARRIHELSSMASYGDRLLAVGPAAGASQTEAGFSASADSGQSWSGPVILSPEDLVRSSYPAIAVNGTGDMFVTWTDTGLVLLRSSRNLGVSWGGWTPLSEEPGNLTARIDAGGEFVAVAWDRDVGGSRGVRLRVSMDSGTTWCPASAPDGTESAREPALALDGATLHVAWIDDAAEGGGIWYRRGSLPRDTTGGGLPVAYALLQSFPNPVNGRAKILFDLPADAEVVLRVFNVLGEVVMTPAQGRFARGRYEVPVEVGGLASGVYFYRLTAPGFEGVGRMAVVR